MAETYRLSGYVSAYSYVAITPPADKAYVIGPGFTFLQDSVRLAYRDRMASPGWSSLVHHYGCGKPFWVVHSGGLRGAALPVWRYLNTNEPGNLNGTVELHLVNYTDTDQPYLITGPVVTLDDEGIVDSFTCGIWGSLGPTTWRTDAVMPAGYCYRVSGVFTGTSDSNVRLLAADNSEIMILPRHGRPFWLWSEQQLKFQIDVSQTNYGGGMRVVRYAEGAQLDEYANRISHNQMVAAGAYVDLQPPADETWYVDLHNWPRSGLYLKWNGTTAINSTYADAFQLSSVNWMRFHNGDGGGSRRLFISGTKIKD